MKESQLILYIFSVLFLLYYLRRFFQRAHMKEYSPNQVAEMLMDDSIVLIDVRTRDERNRHRITGSLHLPLNEIKEKIKTLDKYKQKEIVCYCHSGRRSFFAAAMLQKHGFNAANMKGGISEWNYQNLKL